MHLGSACRFLARGENDSSKSLWSMQCQNDLGYQSQRARETERNRGTHRGGDKAFIKLSDGGNERERETKKVPEREKKSGMFGQDVRRFGSIRWRPLCPHVHDCRCKRALRCKKRWRTSPRTPRKASSRRSRPPSRSTYWSDSVPMSAYRVSRKLCRPHDRSVWKTGFHSATEPGGSRTVPSNFEEIGEAALIIPPESAEKTVAFTVPQNL